MSLTYIQGPGDNYYEILDTIENHNYVCIFAVDSNFLSFYALPFPSFALTEYYEPALDKKTVVVIPLTVQIVQDLFLGAQLYVGFCLESNLPGDIPLYQDVTYNGFMPQVVKDLISSKFPNPVTN